MKKLTSLFLASLLSLSLFAFCPMTPPPSREPDPIPVETIQPNKPDQPPAGPQDELPDPTIEIWNEF